SRSSVAERARQRDAVRIDAQVAEPLGIPPAAKAVGAVLVGAVRVVADFANHPRAVAGAKRSAGRIAQLRAADPRPGRVAVEQGEEYRPPLLGIDPQPDRRRAERIAWPARGQVEGRLRRPAEGRVDEQATGFGVEEFAADRLLADAQAPLVEMMLVPQFVQAGGGERLDPADLVQVVRVAEGQSPPMDLVGAGEEDPSPV